MYPRRITTRTMILLCSTCSHSVSRSLIISPRFYTYSIQLTRFLLTAITVSVFLAGSICDQTIEKISLRKIIARDRRPINLILSLSNLERHIVDLTTSNRDADNRLRGVVTLYFCSFLYRMYQIIFIHVWIF